MKALDIDKPAKSQDFHNVRKPFLSGTQQCTVERCRLSGHPGFVDTPPLWTLFPGPFVTSHISGRGYDLWCLATTTFTSVDTSLSWTLSVRPSGAHIAEVLLY